MKRILLLLSLMTLPTQAEEAKSEEKNSNEKKEFTDNWTGWKLAINQMLCLKNLTATDSWGEVHKFTSIDYTLGGSVEYGWSLQNNLYIGVNTDLNFNWIHNEENDLYLVPKLTLKGGFTQGNAMAFLGAGLGYKFVVSEPSGKHRGIHPVNKDGKQGHVPTWHFQVGSIYKISGKTFVGITWEYEKNFSKDDEITGPYKRKDVSFGESRLIWKIGMQF